MRWNYYKLRQLSLLQSAMACYYKLRQLFYYKVRHGLLQITTGITKCDGFITKWRQVLQSAMIITNCDSTPVMVMTFSCSFPLPYRGGSRIFFRRGCTRLLLYFNTLHPPPRSAPALIESYYCCKHVDILFQPS